MSEIHLSVIIPAFNEEKRLPRYLDQVAGYLCSRNIPFEIIVVDDGSSDGTSAVVSKLQQGEPRLKLITLPENRGKGAAVRAGMLAGKGELVLFADADGATPIAEVERLEAAVRQGADVAVASRALRDEQTVVNGRVHRKFMGSVFNLMVQALAVPGIRDTQCGFKLFTARAVSLTFPHQTIEDFGFDVELLFLANKQGLRLAEIPVNWTDIAGTKVKVFRDSLRMLQDIIGIRWKDIRGRYRCESST